jgi:cobalt-zinc-cadmium efflux system outer membrane protein
MCRITRRLGSSRTLAIAAAIAAIVVVVAVLTLPLRAQQPAVARPAAFDPTIERLPTPAEPQAAPTAPESRPPEPSPLDQREVLQLGPTRLADFEQTALENHPQLASAWNAVQVAEGKAWQARLYPNPEIGAGAPQLGGDESQYQYFVSQDILTGKKKRLDQAAACQEVEQARLAMTRARFEVLTAVRRRFYEALAAQNRVAVLGDLLQLSTKSQEIGRAVFKGGEGTKTDVLLLEIEFHRAEVALVNAQTSLESLKRQLAAAAGTPGLPIGTLYGDLSAESFRLEFDQAQEEASFLNAQTGIAQAEAERARILLRRAIVEPYPTFNVMGGYMRQLEGVRDMGMFQVTMSVPLWDRNQGGIQAAEAGIGKAEAEVRRVQVELAGRAAEALGRYRTALALIERYQRDILPRSRESIELTQRLYEQGQIDFLRLLQAQKTLNDVNLGYIDAQAARWDAAADLGNLLQIEEFP